MEKFERLEKLIGSFGIDKLHNSTILVLGVGGVGGYVVESLARSGVGHLVLVDFDIVDITNINRQIIATTKTIGKKKILAFKERLLDINPNIIVDTYDLFYNQENKNIIFDNKYDYVIDAVDCVDAKKTVIAECLKRKIPVISSMGTGNRMDPCKLFITKLSKTNYDPLARILRKWARDEEIEDIDVLTSSEETVKVEGIGSNSFVPATAGLIIASFVVKKIVGF